MKQPRRITIALFWILAIGMLTVFIKPLLQARYNPNQHIKTTHHGQTKEIVLTRNYYHAYVATGTINDHPVTFLLDTGATYVSVPTAVAEKLHLQPGAPGMAETANGPVRVYAITINKLTLGDITLHNVRGHINTGMRGKQVLLGMSALKQLEFTQNRDTLILRQR